MILLNLLLAASTATASADSLREAPYKLEVVRDGVTSIQVAGPYWQGEYPGPVIDVNSKKKGGHTRVQGWTSLRKLENRRPCTIRNGLYHPWSQTRNSVISFYTIAGAADYVVSQDLTADLRKGLWPDSAEALVEVKAGAQIINVFYGAEGVSSGILVQGEKKTPVSFPWDIFDTNPTYFEATLKTESLGKGEEGPVPEQWLYVRCSEGGKAFIQDSDLLSNKGVKEGTIVDWGTVKGAE